MNPNSSYPVLRNRNRNDTLNLLLLPLQYDSRGNVLSNTGEASKHSQLRLCIPQTQFLLALHHVPNSTSGSDSLSNIKPIQIKPTGTCAHTAGLWPQPLLGKKTADSFPVHREHHRKGQTGSSFCTQISYVCACDHRSPINQKTQKFVFQQPTEESTGKKALPLKQWQFLCLKSLEALLLDPHPFMPFTWIITKSKRIPSFRILHKDMGLDFAGEGFLEPFYRIMLVIRISGTE